MRRRSLAARERGVALAVAIFALAVIGGIIGGTFGVALLEQQSGRNLLFLTQAAEAAEAQVWEALATTPESVLASLVPGGAPREVAPSGPVPGVSGVIQVSRLADKLFLIRSQASRVDAAGTPLASRVVALLARLSADTLASPHRLRPIGQRPWLQLY
jgi:hypothetical protein